MLEIQDVQHQKLTDHIWARSHSLNSIQRQKYPTKVSNKIPKINAENEIWLRVGLDRDFERTNNAVVKIRMNNKRFNNDDDYNGNVNDNNRLW